MRRVNRNQSAEPCLRLWIGSCLNEKDRRRFPCDGLIPADLRGSTLTGLKALLRLVDHIDAAFTAHDLAIAMTRLQRAERIRNFHRSSPVRGASAPNENNVPPLQGAVNGGEYQDRTGGHYDVNVVLYR
jgi:hypothetical protein